MLAVKLTAEVGSPVSFTVMVQKVVSSSSFVTQYPQPLRSTSAVYASASETLSLFVCAYVGETAALSPPTVAGSSLAVKYLVLGM